MLRRLSVPVVLSAAVFLLGCGKKVPPPNPSTKPPVVEVSVPVYKAVTDYEDFTGRLEALKTVEVRSRVTGYLDAIHFKDGAEVKQDQLLFEIDPRTLKATLAQTEANYRQAEAHLKRLNADVRRARALLPKKGISREDYDKIIGDRDEAEAGVGVAVANRNFARINLEYTRVTAPIAGRLSRRLIDPGNLVKADETPLTTIVYLDRMYVYFDINERTFLRIQRLIEDKKILSAQENKAPILLRLADEKDYSPHSIVSQFFGFERFFEFAPYIDFEDNRLDAGTGTYRVRAVVPNRDRFYSPNLFARVRLPIGRPHQALLVSEQALATDQGQKFLYVLTADNKARYRAVQVGRVHQGLREITAGLKPGDKVIVRGLQRIRDGFEVTPKLVTMPVTTTTLKKKAAATRGKKLSIK